MRNVIKGTHRMTRWRKAREGTTLDTMAREDLYFEVTLDLKDEMESM